MQIYLDSVGCRLNWSEIERLARQLRRDGHTVVATPHEADGIVLNTCAVTAQAERKSRHTVRSLHRKNPAAQIAVLGCYATLRPGVSASLPGVSWVIPNEEKDRAVDVVGAGSSTVAARPPGHVSAKTLRTRGFVKVQDGCDNRCTYCIIRALRGPSTSRPSSDVIAEIEALTASGCREVVLTGASLGAYGRDLGASGGLRALILSILSETDVQRIRLSSLESWDIDGDFFELWEDSRLCRQLHLPLQAGCDATLRRMGRPTTTEAFARLVEAAREAVPDIAVTTDVLVGFPGESDQAFRASYGFVQEMSFAKLHVFPYSPRPDTPATRLPRQVPRDVRDRRAAQMRQMAGEQRRRYQARFLGRELPVLWERKTRAGRWTGWSDNYIRVVARAGRDLSNRITGARLRVVRNGYVEGEVVG